MDETAKGTDGRKEERRVYSMHFTPRILIEEDPMEPESDGPLVGSQLESRILNHGRLCCLTKTLFEGWIDKITLHVPMWKKSVENSSYIKVFSSPFAWGVQFLALSSSQVPLPKCKSLIFTFHDVPSSFARSSSSSHKKERDWWSERRGTFLPGPTSCLPSLLQFGPKLWLHG